MPDIERINRWLAATGTTESKLGLLSCANQYAVARIREGSATVKTLRCVLDYIESHPAPKPLPRKRSARP